MDLFSLKGKVAVVTGGGRGLGRGMALALGAAGADVVVVSRSLDQVEAVREELERLGSRALAYAADVADLDAAGAAVEAVLAAYGRIDILVNAAGIQVRRPILEFTPADWERVIGVNLRAAFFLSQRVARHMIERGQGGKIIHVASLTSFIGIPGTGIYAASKSGIVGITRAMAVEWAPYGIRVNAIAPGYYRTEMTEPLFRDPDRSRWVLSRIPVGRSGVPEDLAGTVVFLASPASDYVTGQVIPVDGGWLAG
ncbi:glucose 1-dehydrogenase [Caldinitratiruptor microaerophilus]|uniref:2-deoxy-D-gluconate 3-dehydrogenase n=1 Tax=Caldinitratiruptor microaerophilus TaxID=671077 RepID=A0AA35CKN3_9FIRM|nr:glucose 1-dehydrogenase [Caldinitratiruptor microaerophilus]BDG60173.1 2-deoxy-D-gluconate 3-dehydrogenase [Caldinitratiruptor microaerophilus]